MLVLPGQRRGAEFLAFSPDGVLLAVTDRGGPVEVWDVPAGRLAHTIPARAHSDAYGLQFHPLTGELYLPANSAGVLVFDPKSGASKTTKLRGAVVARAAVAPDGRCLLYYHYQTTCREIRRRDVRPNGRTVKGWAVPLYPPDNQDGWTRSLQFVGDGSRFATTDYAGKGGNRVAVRSVEDGALLKTAAIPHAEPWGLAVSADASWFVVRGGGSLMVWHESEFASDPHVLKPGKKQESYSAMAFHPNGRLLAVAAGQQVLFLGAGGTWKPVMTFACGIGRLTGVCVAPDGSKAAAAASDGRIAVWDLDV